MRCFFPYLALAQFTCFDGDPKDPAGDPKDPAGDPKDPAGDPKDPTGDGSTFTQDDVNRMLAEDRRKHQVQLKTMETRLQEVLSSKNLNESERKALQENLAAVQGQLRSKEQQAALEKQELEQVFQARLQDMEKKSSTWESMYRDSTIRRSLQDAAVKNEAFNPSQIVTLLKPMTKMVEVLDAATQRPSGKFEVQVEMPDIDPKTGQQVMMTRSPEEAVKRMKELSDQYGNLFKSGVVSGIGAGSATGSLMSGSSGQVDVRKLTPQQYREIREKNPELLGLRAKSHR